MTNKPFTMEDNPHIQKRYFQFTMKPKHIQKRPAPFTFKQFSDKQLMVLTWWRKDSPVKRNKALICDGSVRAGKTVVMSLSYIMWAMETFEAEQFGMAGKTIGSFRRNVLTPLKKMLRSRGYAVREYRTENLFTVTRNGRTNTFYMFGGKDDSSQDLIAGITLAGMFFDEVALMPKSFVDQATARCSVLGSKFWFNCNPDGPYHWFKEEWIDKQEEKRAVHLHFTMDDNLSLADEIKEDYKRMYTGLFYKRYILGLWVMAEGVIYDMFNNNDHVRDVDVSVLRDFHVSIDYGTKNPTVFGLWGEDNGTWYKAAEYHHDGRKNGKQKTDRQYSAALKQFLESFGLSVYSAPIIVDPSAASFIAQLKEDGFHVKEAKNKVVDGIRNVMTALQKGMIKYARECKNTFREFSSYVWDEKAAKRGEDKPIKQNDHHMDADRYFVNTILFGPKVFISGQSGW